jgi:hypothetical protein
MSVSGLHIKVNHTLLSPGLDAYSRLYSILRSSSFKIHLKRHGLDPNDYGFSKRDHSPAQALRIKEGQVSDLQVGDSSYTQAMPFLGPLDPWDPFLSLVESGRSINVPVLRELTSCHAIVSSTQSIL